MAVRVEPLRSGDPRGVGRYQFLGRLGAGGMGLVCLGRGPDGRLVAVKLIHEDIAADPDYRRRFAREVRAAAAIQARFTAAVVDADPQAPQPWYACEFIDGPTLGQIVRRTGPLAERALRALAAGLADAVAAFETAGLVHRDLKPDNILLAADGPKVIDFGIARGENDSLLTRAGSILGSPGYMSPEQIAGARVTTASDVFSLGAVLTFAGQATGPFGDGPAEARMYRTKLRAPDISGLPKTMRAPILRCLAKEPHDRPTPRELVTWWSVRTDELDTLIEVGRVPGAQDAEMVRPVGERLYGGGAPTPSVKATPGSRRYGEPTAVASADDLDLADPPPASAEPWLPPTPWIPSASATPPPPPTSLRPPRPWWRQPVGADRLPGGMLRDLLTSLGAAGVLALFSLPEPNTAFTIAYAATALALGFLLGVRRSALALVAYSAAALGGVKVLSGELTASVHDASLGFLLQTAVLLLCAAVIARVGGVAKRPVLGFAVAFAAFIASRAAAVAWVAGKTDADFLAAWRSGTDGLLIYRDAGIAALCAAAVGFLALIGSSQAAVRVDGPHRATGEHR